MSRTTVDLLYSPLKTLFSTREFIQAVKNILGGDIDNIVPSTRTLTINGVTYDLGADREWSIAAGITSFNTRTGAITLTSGDVTGALGYTPYNATNPNNYISGITSSMVTTALGYTPVTNARSLTINGTSYDLSADRSWTVTSDNLYTANGTLTAARTVTSGGFVLTFTGSNTPISTVARGILVNHTLTATAAADTLVALDIDPIFSNPSNYTGVRYVPLRVQGIGLSRGKNADANSVAVGISALINTTTGALYNTALGTFAATNITTGTYNTAIGAYALVGVSTTSFNTAVGAYAQWGNTGASNTSIGRGSLYNVTGSFNNALGDYAGFELLGGSNNTFLGYRAGKGITTGSNNTIIGNGNAMTSIPVTLANHIIIADGSGNQRIAVDSNGDTVLGSTTAYPTFSGYKLDVLGTGRFSGKLSVGTPSAASALFEVTSTTQGLLPPRMTQAQRAAISTPAAGLIVYQTDGTEGLYQYKSTGWEAVGAAAAGGSSASSSLFNYYNFI